MDRMCSINGDCTTFQPPPGSSLVISFELWQVAAA